jgi:hypothetical protein
MVPLSLLKFLHPLQKFERPPFWNGWSYGIKDNRVDVTFSGMTSQLNLTNFYQLIQMLLVGVKRMMAL